MAPTTRAKSAKAGAKDPNLKQTMNINTRGDDSKNTTRRRSHGHASVRSKDTETALQDTAIAAANVSAAPVGSIDPRRSATEPSPVVLHGWNGRRRRTGLPTKDELEVADFLVTEDFRSRLVAAASIVQMMKDPNYSDAAQKASVDVLVAAAIMVQMKKDPKYSAPVQKVSRPNCNQNRRGRLSYKR